MFDNPNKELQRLQDKLLAAEEAEEAELWQKPKRQPVQEDAETALEDVKRILARDDKKAHPVKKPTRDKEEDTPAKKGDGTGGLLVALLLETIGLVAVVAWWLLWR